LTKTVIRGGVGVGCSTGVEKKEDKGGVENR